MKNLETSVGFRTTEAVKERIAKEAKKQDRKPSAYMHLHFEKLYNIK